MRKPGSGSWRQQAGKSRKAGRNRRKSLKCFIKQIRFARSRKKRLALQALLFSAMLYLLAVAAFREKLFSVQTLEENNGILVYGEHGGGSVFDVFRVTIRFKNGELIFFHQKTEFEDGEDS